MLALCISLLFCFTGSAKFEWKGETTHDFGIITKDQPVSHVFKFTNTGDEPLVIVDAKGSCGCTVPSYTKTPILPGQSGDIKVTFNAAKPGSFTKTVTVTANTSEEQVKLYVKGEVQ